MLFKQIDNPQDEQVAAIVSGLNAFGLEQVGGEAPARVAVVCERQGETIGGAVGHSLRHRFYLTQIWVAEPYRSNGIGSRLVAQMEALAREAGCGEIVVDTLNRDAVSFYQRLGYATYLVNPDYVSGFDWCFLRKDFDAPEATHEPG